MKHEKYRHLTVCEHLGHCSKGNFKIMPIYQCENMNRLFRENKKQEIINILQPDQTRPELTQFMNNLINIENRIEYLIIINAIFNFHLLYYYTLGM